MEDLPGDVDGLRTGTGEEEEGGDRTKEGGRKAGRLGMGVVTRGSCDGIFGNFGAIQCSILEFTVFDRCIWHGSGIDQVV